MSYVKDKEIERLKDEVYELRESNKAYARMLMPDAITNLQAELEAAISRAADTPCCTDFEANKPECLNCVPRLKAQLSEAEAKTKLANLAKGLAEGELEDTKAQLSEANDGIVDLNSQVDAANERADEWEMKHREADRERLEFWHKLVDSEKKLTKANREIERLEDRQTDDQLINAVSTYENRIIPNLNNQIAALNDLISELQNITSPESVVKHGAFNCVGTAHTTINEAINKPIPELVESPPTVDGDGRHFDPDLIESPPTGEEND